MGKKTGKKRPVAESEMAVEKPDSELEVAEMSSKNNSKAKKGEKRKREKNHESELAAKPATADPSVKAETPRKKKHRKEKNEELEVPDKVDVKESGVQGEAVAEELNGENTDPSGEGEPVDAGRSLKDLEAVLSTTRQLNERKAVQSRSSGALSALPHWMKTPTILSPDQMSPLATTTHGMSPAVLAALRDYGVTEWFPVQAVTVPRLLSNRGDVCICSPTGSGKTLAYVLPVVEVLHTRVVRLLRALVVVPTRDLAAQVWGVFAPFCEKLGLVAQVVTGESGLAMEKAQLVADDGSSQIDILIATPGRLVEHVANTPNFTLQHLQFLVVDEADRMLSQTYQQWLSTVIAATKSAPTTSLATPSSETDSQLSPHTSLVTPRAPANQPWLGRPNTCPLRKVVCSATLMTDPQQIASLCLYRPVLLAHSGKSHRFQTPAQLLEYVITCAASTKASVLLRLLRDRDFPSTLCFTASVEVSHRLTRLLQLVAEASKRKGTKLTVAELSSNISKAERVRVLSQFTRGEVAVLVCSDVMARGIDIAGVRMVVNYDCPTLIRTYIHRVGRTARAGQSGETFTLVERDRYQAFMSMIARGKGDAGSVKRYTPKPSDARMEKAYAKAMKQLAVVLKAERQHKISTNSTIESILSLSGMDMDEGDEVAMEDAKEDEVEEGGEEEMDEGEEEMDEGEEDEDAEVEGALSCSEDSD